MFLAQEYITQTHTRKSKLGTDHTYSRERTVLLFRCDSCNETFNREKGSMDPKRISNNYFHVCANCDPKKFAQKKGVENRRLWDMKASSLDDVSKL
jgi:hypothetical protein